MEKLDETKVFDCPGLSKAFFLKLSNVKNKTAACTQSETRHVQTCSDKAHGTETAEGTCHQKQATLCMEGDKRRLAT
jgi:hypothetical protein